MKSNLFGRFVTAKRKEKDMSLRGTAQTLELSPSYWNDIEKGRRNPPNINILENLSKILGLGEKEFYEMVDMASKDRDEIPMDLPEYIKDNTVVRIALRKAKDKTEAGGKELTNKAWRNLIMALDKK